MSSVLKCFGGKIKACIYIIKCHYFLQNSLYRAECNALVKYMYNDSIRGIAGRGSKTFLALQASHYQVLTCCKLQQILMVMSEQELWTLVQMQTRHFCALLGRKARAPPKPLRLTHQCAGLSGFQLPTPPILEVQL